jgi:hypothetical protein
MDAGSRASRNVVERNNRFGLSEAEVRGTWTLSTTLAGQPAANTHAIEPAAAFVYDALSR